MKNLFLIATALLLTVPGHAANRRIPTDSVLFKTQPGGVTPSAGYVDVFVPTASAKLTVSNSAGTAKSVPYSGEIVNADLSGSAAISNANLANMAESTIKGRAAGAGTGAPTDLSASQATAILDALVGDSGAGGTKGLAPAPASGDAAAAKFLKADGTWAVPGGSGSQDSPTELTNISITASASANAMTVDLRDKNGNTPTGATAIAFKTSVLNGGKYIQRTVSGATRVTISASATLKTKDAVAAWIYIYALDNNGTVELAVSRHGWWDEGVLQNTTAMSASSTTSHLLYSTTARSNVAIRYIGRFKSTQGTAGTWATAPSEISVNTGNHVRDPFILYVAGNGGGTTAGNVRKFPSVSNDSYNCYSTVSGQCTLPMAGIISCVYFTTGNANNVRETCYVDGNSIGYTSDNSSIGSGNQSGGCIYPVTAGGTIDLRPTNVNSTDNANDKMFCTYAVP